MMLRARFKNFAVNHFQRNGGVELPARILFGKPKIDGRHEEVRVLAAREVGDDEHAPSRD